MAYISVADAVAKTGRGSTTIHRLCRKHENTRFVKREENRFLIDEEFLRKHYAEAPAEQDAHKQEKDGSPELIDIFIEELQQEKNYYRKMLERKDEQLERQDRVIANLQERQRELHHLLHHQTQLLDSYRKSEPEAAQQPGDKYSGCENGVAPQQEPSRENPESGPVPTGTVSKVYPINEVRVVYGILAAVGLVLLLAVIFADQLRALV